MNKYLIISSEFPPGPCGIGQHPFDAQNILSSSRLRSKSLHAFKESELFDTNYIVRKGYRANANTKELRKKTTQAYYQNQFESDFILIFFT